MAPVKGIDPLDIVKFPLGSQTEHSEHSDTQVMDFNNNNLHSE